MDLNEVGEQLSELNDQWNYEIEVKGGPNLETLNELMAGYVLYAGWLYGRVYALEKGMREMMGAVDEAVDDIAAITRGINPPEEEK